MTFFKKGLCTFILAACLPAASYADVNMTFTGTLTIPQCTINNNAVVEFDFKEVQIQTLTEVNIPYSTQQKSIPINCPYTLGTPKIIVNSSAVDDASKGSIQTSKYDEGLVVYVLDKTGAPIKLGEAQDVTTSVDGTNLTLTSGVGRTKDMKELTPGSFTASATMQVMYQ